jgi:hypothetical protein
MVGAAKLGLSAQQRGLCMVRGDLLTAAKLSVADDGFPAEMMRFTSETAESGAKCAAIVRAASCPH